MRYFLKNRILVIFLGLSLSFLLAGLVLILVNADNLSSPLIVHINAYTGVDMTGNIGYLWLIFSMGVLVFIVNLALAYVFFFRERLLSYIILAVTFINSLFILVNIGNIIALN